MKKGDQNVRVFVGTRKGAYLLESNRARKKWKVQGPMHSGNDVYHIVADPRHPREVYAAVNSPFWGPMLYRSKNWGGRWTEVAVPLLPKRSDRKPSMDPLAPEVRPTTNLWHIEPGRPEDPNTIFLGVDPASLYRSDDRGASWTSMPGINEHSTRSKWNPGAGGMCLHSILLDPERPKRMYVGISAAGVFRSDDGGVSFQPKNKGVVVSFMPDKRPEVGQCVHHIALDPFDSNTIYRQDHDGIHVSRDAADTWHRIGKPLPVDFGFVVAAPAAEPGTAYFVPLHPMSRLSPGGQIQVYRWTEKDHRWAPTIKGRKWPGDLGTHREGLTADALDPAGVYLGTTTGQVFYTRDGARNWEEMPYRFPGIHSMTVSSPSTG